jgi:hypothetical protein
MFDRGIPASSEVESFNVRAPDIETSFSDVTRPTLNDVGVGSPVLWSRPTMIRSMDER